MNRSTLEKALGLPEPWRVVKDECSAKEHRLDITIDFERGSTFLCPNCGAESKAYDSVMRTWRHLNFFQRARYLAANTEFLMLSPATNEFPCRT